MTMMFVFKLCTILQVPILSPIWAAICISIKITHIIAAYSCFCMCPHQNKLNSNHVWRMKQYWSSHAEKYWMLTSVSHDHQLQRACYVTERMLHKTPWDSRAVWFHILKSSSWLHSKHDQWHVHKRGSFNNGMNYDYTYIYITNCRA